MNDIIIYQNGEIELNVSIQNESIWLTQKQIAELFNVKIPAISKHIKNIFAQNELIENMVVSKMEITTQFLIINEKEVYDIGASLKDLGKKWFGFSKMDSESFEMGRLK